MQDTSVITLVLPYLPFWQVLRALLLLCKKMPIRNHLDLNNATNKVSSIKNKTQKLEMVNKLLEKVGLKLSNSTTNKKLEYIWNTFVAIPKPVQHALILSHGTWGIYNCTKTDVMKTFDCAESLYMRGYELCLEIICKKFLAKKQCFKCDWYKTLVKHYEKICYGCGSTTTANEMRMYDGIYRLCEGCQGEYCTTTEELRIKTGKSACTVRNRFSSALCGGITSHGAHLYDKRLAEAIIGVYPDRPWLELGCCESYALRYFVVGGLNRNKRQKTTHT